MFDIFFSISFLPNNSGFVFFILWRILMCRKVLHRPALINPLKRNIKQNQVFKHNESVFYDQTCKSTFSKVLLLNYYFLSLDPD